MEPEYRAPQRTTHWTQSSTGSKTAKGEVDGWPDSMNVEIIDGWYPPRVKTFVYLLFITLVCWLDYKNSVTIFGNITVLFYNIIQITKSQIYDSTAEIFVFQYRIYSISGMVYTCLFFTMNSVQISLCRELQTGFSRL